MQALTLIMFIVILTNLVKENGFWSMAGILAFLFAVIGGLMLLVFNAVEGIVIW